jgi:hypothetical protein
MRRAVWNSFCFLIINFLLLGSQGKCYVVPACDSIWVYKRGGTEQSELSVWGNGKTDLFDGAGCPPDSHYFSYAYLKWALPLACSEIQSIKLIMHTEASEANLKRFSKLSEYPILVRPLSGSFSSEQWYDTGYKRPLPDRNAQWGQTTLFADKKLVITLNANEIRKLSGNELVIALTSSVAPIAQEQGDRYAFYSHLGNPELSPTLIVNE